MLELNKDNFAIEVEQSTIPVVIDFWSPQCGPCIALMPGIEKLAEAYKQKIKFAKINVTENRRLCIQLKVMSVPTILFYRDGKYISRLSGDEVSLESIKAEAEALLS